MAPQRYQQTGIGPLATFFVVVVGLLAVMIIIALLGIGDSSDDCTCSRSPIPSATPNG